MNQTQFDTINRLFLLTFQVADRLGSESSDPAQLLLTNQSSLSDCSIYFPSDYRMEVLSLDRWTEYLTDAPPLAEMNRILQSYPCSHGIYRQDEVSGWVCAFWATQSGLGTNLLLRAHRVET
jgi:hypothetical protein